MVYRIFSKPYITLALVSAEQIMSTRNGFLYLFALKPRGICPKLCTRKSMHTFASLRIVKNVLYVKSFTLNYFNQLVLFLIKEFVFHTTLLIR